MLTAEQRKILIDILSEERGGDLSFSEFADAMLGLFEDIPGFETIPPAKANDNRTTFSLIKNLSC